MSNIFWFGHGNGYSVGVREFNGFCKSEKIYEFVNDKEADEYQHPDQYDKDEQIEEQV